MLTLSGFVAERKTWLTFPEPPPAHQAQEAGAKEQGGARDRDLGGVIDNVQDWLLTVELSAFQLATTLASMSALIEYPGLLTCGPAYAGNHE